MSLFLASRASAQLAGSVGLDSDYRLRGYSLTDDHPALTAQLSYDHPSGTYFNLTGLTELGHDTRFLGVIGGAGYAKRLNDQMTVDAGVLRYQIGEAALGRTSFKYTELYAGAYIGPVSGRIYYSPDYRSSGIATLYGELEAGFEPSHDWRLSGHVGLLTYLNSAAFYAGSGTRADWRVSVTRQFGRFEIHSALSNRKLEPYDYQARRSLALTAGASFSF